MKYYLKVKGYSVYYDLILGYHNNKPYLYYGVEPNCKFNSTLHFPYLIRQFKKSHDTYRTSFKYKILEDE